MEKVVGVIPARYGSTRFPGKPLALVNGKPLLQWVIERAKASRTIQKLLVATDDTRIAELAKKCGAAVAMTESELPTGSDRVWQAVKHEVAELVINIQGDEPLITGELLDALVAPLLKDNKIEMATLGRKIRPGDLEAKSTAKIVLNHKDEAIYFSRFPIPYSRIDAPQSNAVCLKHIGIYAYRKTFLEKFCAQPPVAIELAEGLEQMRALYLGARIRVIQVEHDSWGVDSPEDVKKIEEIMRSKE